MNHFISFSEDPTVAPDHCPSVEEKGEPPLESAPVKFFSSRLASFLPAFCLADLSSLYSPFQTLLETGIYDGFWWLDITVPSHEDIEILARAFSLDDSVIEDIKMGVTRFTFECFPLYYFFSLQSPLQNEKAARGSASQVNIYAFAFQGGLLSFSPKNNPHVANVRNRIRQNRYLLPLSSGWICYVLM
jgi:Mg2+ and Co2+ transporter CorA